MGEDGLKRALCVLLGAFTIVWALAGCSASTSVETGDALREELILAVGSEPETGFDPTAGWGRYGSPLFQSTLLKRDAQLRIVHDLAEHYEVSEDGKVWTFTLRRDAKFSDGQPVTAEDVKFTFDTAAQNAAVLDLTNVERVKATDEHTVNITLRRPQSTFVNVLVTLGIVPKHAYGSDYAERPVGSGPYRLVQWDKGQQIIVEANPLYYGPKPYFQRLTFLFLSEDAAFAAAKAGEVDMAYIPSAFGKQSVPGMRLVAVKTVDNRGIVFPYRPSGEQTEEGYPIGNDVTADLAVRKAVNVAVDRQLLVEGVLEGYGSPAYSAVDGLPWWNEQTVFEDGNVDEARRILAEAGWSDADGDGVVEKGSLKAEFTLLYPAGDGTRQALALAVADRLKEVGIRVHVDGKSWDDIRRLMHANAVLLGFGSHDPTEMYHLYSSAFQGIDYFNPGYYGNPVVDAWLNKAMMARTEEEAIEYWKLAQWDGENGMSALGDAPWAWLVNIDHLYFVDERLDIGQPGIQPHGHGWPITDNIAEWRWHNDGNGGFE